MTQTLQLEPKIEIADQLADVPKFLVEWSSPWHEFVTAIGPALARSQARLAGEAPYGIFPYRGMVPCLLAEALLIFASIVIKVKIDQMRPYVVPRLTSHDVIYYSGDELPRTEDVGGAQAGTSGRSGGDEAHHRTQTIRIARGGSLTAQVVDAPSLKLPASHDAVANLLAVKPNPGPPPAEGLRSARTPLTFEAPVVAPAPEVIHDYTRNGIKLDVVIAPPTTPVRDPFRAAPNLSASVVPPAPSVANEHSLVAPALGSPVIAPAPSVSRDRVQSTPSLQTAVVAPAPVVAGDRTRSAPVLNSSVIAPAPAAVSRQVSSAPVQMATAVVPPPVSAPERSSARDPKLNLPAPSVIAPAPSSDISQDMRRLNGGSVPDPSKSVVAPPPTQTGSGSLVSSLIGKIFGSSEVVPPPPSVSSGGSVPNHATLNSDVVPPPPAVDPNGAGGNLHGSRRGTGASPGLNVIAPPPVSGLAGGTGNRSVADSKAPAIGIPNVVPPPPALPGSGGGTGTTAGTKGTPGGTLLASNVVPPPPSMGEGSGASGSGTGRRGIGLGGSMETGSVLAPPSGGGSGNGAGVVASAQPGTKVGLPATGEKGALAVSPSGGNKSGIGGSGGGSSIGSGTGSGSGLKGEGGGAGKAGNGHGSDPGARGGISPANGPGGAGSAPAGNPPVPGVSVSGGTSVVTLPSFGDPSSGSSNPVNPPRSNARQSQQLEVTVVATASSGGAFEAYKNRLNGLTKTAYIDTNAGTVVLEYADATGTGNTAEDLSSPAGIRVDLPNGLPHRRMVIECTIDASGNVRNIKMLEPGSAEMVAKVVPALRSWKLQPAMRGNQPVEVRAILGLGIDTNDQF